MPSALGKKNPKLFRTHSTQSGENLECNIMHGKVPGERGRGSSPTRWMDCIRIRLRSVPPAVAIVQDRESGESSQEVRTVANDYKTLMMISEKR